MTAINIPICADRAFSSSSRSTFTNHLQVLKAHVPKLFLSKNIFPGKDENYNSHHHIYDHLYDYNNLIQQLNDCIAFFKRDFTWTPIT